MTNSVDRITEIMGARSAAVGSDDGRLRLLAEAGDDTLEATAGDDLIFGGAGADTASYVSNPAGVVVSLLLQGALQNTGGSGWDELSGIENLRGSNYSDWLFGDHDANRLEGMDGADHLYGNGGDDLLIGGLDNDTLVGGEGVDRASYVDSSGGVTVSLVEGRATGRLGTDSLEDIEEIRGSTYIDALIGDDLANRLEGMDGDDFLNGRLGDDALDGGSGRDTAAYSAATGSVIVDLVTGRSAGACGADTLESIENALGGVHADTLSGDGRGNRLEGSLGDDSLRGRGGNDVLDGGGGVDRAMYDDASGGVSVYLHLGTASGAAGRDELIEIEDVTGSDDNDTIVGSAVANRIGGGNGDDNIYGREGDDVLDGGDGVDTASYWDAPGLVYVDLGSGVSDLGGGTDTLTNLENLIGSFFGDQLIGDAGVNAIDGFQGADTIVGQGGADVLTGGEGADIFWYDDLLDADDDFAALEEITDFVSGTDRIDLSAIDPGGATGDQAFTFIGTTAFSTTSLDEVRFADGVVYVDTDSDVAAEMAIALTGVTSVGASDFAL